MSTIEAEARALSKAERVAYLREHGWYRLSYRGSQAWFSPGWQRINRHLVVAPEHDRCFYSLAAAIRNALRREHEE